MDPVTVAVVSAAAPTLLGIVFGWFHHLISKSHNETVQAIVSKVQPVAEASIQAGTDAGAKALAGGATPEQALQVAGAAAAAHAAASVVPMGPPAP